LKNITENWNISKINQDYKSDTIECFINKNGHSFNHIQYDIYTWYLMLFITFGLGLIAMMYGNFDN